jgi:tight adherence protein B
MALIAAGLVFVAVVAVIVVVFWFLESRRAIRGRLRVTPASEPEILRARAPESGSAVEGLLERVRLAERLSTLLRQAGRSDPASTWVWIVAGCALAGAVAGGLRTGRVSTMIVAALLTGALPLLYLIHQRHQRLKKFQAQFPDSLDTMSRALRTGYALGGAIQLVGDEMPEPVGPEFKRVFEEIRLGMDPTEALVRLRQRAPTEDLEFFCSALIIQRGSGGNLTEILDHLSEVIRERFKLLSHIRALSAQHKWSAICVGLSPVVFAGVFHLMSPRYFDSLWDSPLSPYLLGAGFLMEAIGFVMVWRIAQIKV